jgi:hypothetical protein
LGLASLLVAVNEKAATAKRFQASFVDENVGFLRIFADGCFIRVENNLI